MFRHGSILGASSSRVLIVRKGAPTRWGESGICPRVQSLLTLGNRKLCGEDIDCGTIRHPPNKTDRNLLFAPARTQRCAGEGELVFQLTEHGLMLPVAGLAHQGVIGVLLRVSGRSQGGSEGAAPWPGTKPAAHCAAGDVARQAPFLAKGTRAYAGSIAQHILVVRHRVHIPARLAGVWTGHPVAPPTSLSVTSV